MGDSPLGWLGGSVGEKVFLSDAGPCLQNCVFCYSSTMVFRKMFSEAVSCSLFDVDSTGVGGGRVKKS